MQICFRNSNPTACTVENENWHFSSCANEMKRNAGETEKKCFMIWFPISLVNFCHSPLIGWINGSQSERERVCVHERDHNMRQNNRRTWCWKTIIFELCAVLVKMQEMKKERNKRTKEMEWNGVTKRETIIIAMSCISSVERKMIFFPS